MADRTKGLTTPPEHNGHECTGLNDHLRCSASESCTAVNDFHQASQGVGYLMDERNLNARTPGQCDSEEIVKGPFEYLRALPGKNVRDQMIIAFNESLNVPSSGLETITKVIGMLHTASLLIDDIEDNSLLRRGQPAAHTIFGVAQTINSANFVYFLALNELQQLGSKDAIRIFAEELLQLHLGQGMDLYWREALTCPTEREYFEMVRKKTGGLFRLAVRLMQTLSPRNNAPDCIPLADTMGILFQIRDDYQNLADTNYLASKGMCEDLTEGKFSFPIIHSIRQDPSNRELLHILKLRTTDLKIKRRALDYMEGTGSFIYTKRTVGDLVYRARSMALELGDDGHGVLALLDTLSLP